ncbi:GDSL esterase/lipase At1g28580-like [Carex rostrata]
MKVSTRPLLLLSLCFSCLSFGFAITDYYNAIFSFGDSFSDTGNFVIMESPVLPNIPVFPPPYARCSNGRLVIDFMAEYFGLPLLPPSHSISKNFTQGANFAVIGATALPLEYFKKNNIYDIPPINSSLPVQLDWFDDLKQYVCNSTQECKDFFRRSLFIIGEFGGNDYSFAMKSGRTVEQVKGMVPTVVDAICAAVEKLINDGARHVLVPGNLPSGCIPIMLTFYQSSNKDDYDPRTGCLKGMNSLALYHNAVLRIALEKLNNKYPEARVIYGDYYGPVVQFARTPELYGFTNGALMVCCGGGGPYNYNASASCGLPGAIQCTEPNSHVSWDGIHLTEAAYHYIANGWIKGPYAYPPLISVMEES